MNSWTDVVNCSVFAFKLNFRKNEESAFRTLKPTDSSKISMKLKCPIVSNSEQVPKPNLQAHCHHTKLFISVQNDHTVVMRKKEKDGIENNWIFRPDSTTLYAWALSNIPQERNGYWILLILFANRLKFSNNAQLLHFTFSQSKGDTMIKDRSSKNSLNLKWCVLCQMVQKRLGALAKSLQRASLYSEKSFFLSI